MRARGLKLVDPPWPMPDTGVAPHAGAWIETNQIPRVSKVQAVAPHAGAWIETWIDTSYLLTLRLSRPMRARGLKLIALCMMKDLSGVAPHAGAWIETGHKVTAIEKRYGRAPCGRVD